MPDAFLTTGLFNKNDDDKERRRRTATTTTTTAAGSRILCTSGLGLVVQIIGVSGNAASLALAERLSSSLMKSSWDESFWQ